MNAVNLSDVPVDAHPGRCGLNANNLGISLPPHLAAILILFKGAVHALGPKPCDISEAIGGSIRLNEYVSNLTTSIPGRT